MSRARTAFKVGGLVAAAGTIAGIGLAAGFTAERYLVGRQRLRPDPEAREPFGRLRGRARTVLADDGVALHVEEVGDLDAPVTVVFVHGYVLSMACWHYQWRGLGGPVDPIGRLVFYDQRSHGRSGRSTPESSTIDQLGRDLFAVINDLVPTGPIVLIGHSMGGMTVMALADQHPELFGDRILGVALVSTAPSRIGETMVGAPVLSAGALQKVAPALTQRLKRRAALIESGRRAGSDLGFLATRRISFGGDVNPSLVAFMEQMILGTPIEVMLDFLPTFFDHDKLNACGVLASVDTLVIVGDTDRLTPKYHSEDIAKAVPTAQLIVMPGAGHMVMLERPELVNLHVRALVQRVRERVAARSTR